MSTNSNQIAIQTPTFGNLEEECKFWKETALKFQEKYENVKKLYAEALCKSNVRRPLKRPASSQPWILNKKARTSFDPFDQEIFDATIQTAIINKMEQKDLLTMTEVSRKWKNLIECNRLLDDVKLRVDMRQTGETPGLELLQSMRRYKALDLKYDSCDRLTSFRILYKFARTLQHVSIFERQPGRIKHLHTAFPQLRSLKFNSFMDNNVCDFIGFCEFENLEEVHIRRRGPSEGLSIFLHETGTLLDLHIAADSRFYRSWAIFMRDQMEQAEPEMLLERLHIEIIDSDDYAAMALFTSQADTLKSLKFSGICKFNNVIMAVTFFPELVSLELAFTSQGDNIEGSDDDDDAEEEEESRDVLPMRQHEQLSKLIIHDAEIMTWSNLESLFENVPNLRRLEIYSSITLEIMSHIIEWMALLEVLVYTEINADALMHLQEMQISDMLGIYNTDFQLIHTTDCIKE